MHTLWPKKLLHQTFFGPIPHKTGQFKKCVVIYGDYNDNHMNNTCCIMPSYTESIVECTHMRLHIFRILYPFVMGFILLLTLNHDDVIKRKHFPHYWPFVLVIHRSPVNPPHKGQWRFNVFFDRRLNKRLSKQSWGWWSETPSCSLWRHCNALLLMIALVPVKRPGSTNVHKFIRTS